MFDFTVFAQPEAWMALLTLTAMEVVLGIDNIVFITILVGRLPPSQQNRGRRIGLALALVSRLALLFAISWIMRLNNTLFTVFDHSFTGRDIVLEVGGLFLIFKAANEIFDKLEAPKSQTSASQSSSFASVIAQIIVLDIVFSLDSVITAVGMVKELPIMVVAMVIAVGVMLVFAKSIGDFVERHPSMKILALSFLLMIGVLLVAEGLGQHVNKGYIYFGMAFSLGVELLNLWVRKRQNAVMLHPSSREP